MHEEFTELLHLLQFVRLTPGREHKALCRFAQVLSPLAQQLLPFLGIDISGFAFAVDSYGLRHALTGHSQERGSRDHYPLLEADILALPSWLTAPPVVKASNPPKNALQPRRVRFERPELFSALKTVVVLEARTGRKQLVLVTMSMYKTENG
jgi:hypothetical protein